MARKLSSRWDVNPYACFRNNVTRKSPRIFGKYRSHYASQEVPPVRASWYRSRNSHRCRRSPSRGVENGDRGGQGKKRQPLFHAITSSEIARPVRIRAAKSIKGRGPPRYRLEISTIWRGLFDFPSADVPSRTKNRDVRDPRYNKIAQKTGRLSRASANTARWEKGS